MTAILETEICRLLPLHTDHAEDYIALANHPLIRDRVNNAIPYTQKHFDELLAAMAKNPRHLTWVIDVEGVICGAVTTGAMGCPERFQGGYWLHPNYWGRGLATAALTISNQFIWNHFTDVLRIQAVVEPDNLASITVLEKCGYQREGLLRKFYPSRYRGLVDVLMYAQIRED